MSNHARILLEMAEQLADLGERDLARECREIADKMLDYIMYAAQMRQKGTVK